MLNRMKEIAIITEEFPPSRAGGIKEWALGITENLVLLGYQVTVFTKWKGKEFDIAKHHENKPYKVIRMKGHDWHKYRFWFSLYYSWKYLRQHPTCTILTATWELGYAFTFLKNYFPQAKLIIGAHGLEITRKMSNREVSALRKTVKCANLVIAVSNFTKEKIIEKIIENNNNIEFIPNGLEVKNFNRVQNTDKLRKELGIQDNSKIILTLARVIERKGHDTVIKSLSTILKVFPNTMYVIAGTYRKEMYDKLMSLSKELKIEDKVILTGFVDRNRLNEYYSMSDVYVMVSRFSEKELDSEGFGITFLEANACEIPVIGSYSGGIPDAIQNEESGYLVQPDNIKELSSRIIQLFSNKELSEKIGKQGRLRAIKSFTWETIVQKIIEKANI